MPNSVPPVKPALIKKFLEQLDEQLYDVPDSCLGNEGDPFIKIDAQLSPSVYEELASWAYELGEQVSNLNKLLAYGGPIHKLASYNMESHIDEILAEDLNAHDEGLNHAVNSAHNSASEKLLELVDKARDDIEDLVGTLNHIQSELV